VRRDPAAERVQEVVLGGLHDVGRDLLEAEMI
jgi:hypothetical protein